MAIKPITDLPVVTASEIDDNSKSAIFKNGEDLGNQIALSELDLFLARNDSAISDRTDTKIELLDQVTDSKLDKKVSIDGSIKMMGNLNLNDFLITNLKSGVNPKDAVNKTQLDAKAPIDSPFFQNNPQAPTQAVGDNSTNLATTAFVQANKGSSGFNFDSTLKIDKVGQVTSLPTQVGQELVLAQSTKPFSQIYAIAFAFGSNSNTQNFFSYTLTALDILKPFSQIWHVGNSFIVFDVNKVSNTIKIVIKYTQGNISSPYVSRIYYLYY